MNKVAKLALITWFNKWFRDKLVMHLIEDSQIVIKRNRRYSDALTKIQQGIPNTATLLFNGQYIDTGNEQVKKFIDKTLHE